MKMAVVESSDGLNEELAKRELEYVMTVLRNGLLVPKNMGNNTLETYAAEVMAILGSPPCPVYDDCGFYRNGCPAAIQMENY